MGRGVGEGTAMGSVGSSSIWKWLRLLLGKVCGETMENHRSAEAMFRVRACVRACVGRYVGRDSPLGCRE